MTKLAEQLNLASVSPYDNLEQMYAAARQCTNCDLCKARNNVVLFRGNPEAKLMIIGEGPGQNEDETGLPFVGRAGQLLDKILASAEIDKEKDVYICNVVKCRPPGNRVPTPQEMAQCKGFLEAQIQFIDPKLILLAGSTAMQAILQVKNPISKVRGKWFDQQNGAKVMAIFHPSYLLRNDSREVGSPKWLMWQDIKEVKRQLDVLNGSTT
ncbi:MAG: uracil-DNA glycosylase [Candidatus Obscuribacterales bacterium]|nr:uracil-DNA glycosylase [Candidatus Obscuribacterales bacterium]